MTTQPTDMQLKQALAKMLPNEVFIGLDETLCWHDYNEQPAYPVVDTELLHLCWMVEQSLDVAAGAQYGFLLDSICGNDYNTGKRKGNTGRKESASWQQRVIALCTVKGVEIL